MRALGLGAFLFLVLGGCQFFHWRDEMQGLPPTPPPPELKEALEVAEASSTFEPTFTSRYLPATTIEFDVGGTEDGLSALGGAVVVEKVHRDTADGQLAVRVRLRNELDRFIRGEFLIAFYDEWHHRLIGDFDTWRRVMLLPLDRGMVSNVCLVRGARTFILYLRELPPPPPPPPPLPEPEGEAPAAEPETPPENP